MIDKITLFLNGVRYKNIITALICCLLAAFKLNSFSDMGSIIPIIMVVLLMMITNLANDILDIKTDSINRPNRPLIIQPSIAKYFKRTILILTILIILLSFFVNLKAQCIAIGSVPLLIFYSKLFKPKPLIGNIFVALYLSLVFVFMEIAITDSIRLMIIPAIFAFGISLIREIVKDMQDYKGDQESGVMTLPILIGMKSCAYFVNFLIVCFLLTCGIIILDFYYFYYIVTLVFIVFMPLFYLMFFLIKKPTAKSCGEASALLKKITILGLIIIYIT